MRVGFFGLSRYHKALKEGQDLSRDKDADKTHALMLRGLSYKAARIKVKGGSDNEKVLGAEERRTGNRNTDSDPSLP